MGLLHIAGSARRLNPHNIFMAMFSPSSAHVAPFCPHNGADSARQYACKYAGKPEKWYYLEGDASGVKEFLICLRGRETLYK